ncbi:hypothetical protein LDC_1270 [sediment metagenome]|uniref:Uncharacterized protein n=1 Tax=sediment metagenome TaxID=749907 RepID=D9PIB4_9ZZZZ
MYSSSAFAITGKCLKFIWFVGSSSIKTPGFKNTKLQKATSHFCHSESAQI